MSFNLDEDGKSPKRSGDANANARDSAARGSAVAGAGAQAPLRPWLTPLVIGVSVGVVLALAGGRMLSTLSRPPSAPADEAPPARIDAQPSSPPTAAEPASAHPVDSPAQAVAAPEDPVPAAPAPEAHPPPAESRPSTTPANPAPSARAAPVTASPARAASNPQPLVVANSGQPVRASSAPEAKPAAVAQPRPAEPPPSAAAEPVDPNSQDAKLAAAAKVQHNAGTVIDSMLDQALSAPRAPAQPAPVQAAAMPASPSRDDVVKAMSVLVPAIRGCAQGQSGLATFSISVHNDGRVESAALSGAPFEGTASGRCMEGVVRRARFPRFQQPSFRVQFPFSIQ